MFRKHYNLHSVTDGSVFSLKTENNTRYSDRWQELTGMNLLILLVLAAQFESFIDPLIIMFTVPLAIAGAFLTLKIFGHTINIFSEIGMIMLIGLVTKNGILIVEFANQNRLKKGMKKTDAVI